MRKYGLRVAGWASRFDYPVHAVCGAGDGFGLGTGV